MTLDEAFLEINDNGWLVNNLYQRDDGSWRANLRQADGAGNWFNDFGEGSTPLEALLATMAKCIDREKFIYDEQVEIPTTFGCVHTGLAGVDEAIRRLRKDGTLVEGDDYDTNLQRLRETPALAPGKKAVSLIDQLGIKPQTIKRRI